MSFDVVSAYTLLVGDGEGPPSVSVHATADDAWRMLDQEIRSRCWMRPRPRRRMDADSTTRLANAWRLAEPENRYWNLTVHRLPVPMPEIARVAVGARAAVGDRVAVGGRVAVGAR